MNAIGVDVGGTKISAGIVTPEGEVLSSVRHPTPEEPGELVSAIAGAIAEVRGEYEAGGVCLAVPGLILAQEGRVVFSPNLKAIEGILLEEELEPEVGLPILIENDANAAAWGEFWFGAGSGVDHLVLVTLGTGVGGGVVLHGTLLRGAQGAGGELGHTTVHSTGPRCSCGNRGCLEILASGTAIQVRAQRFASEHPHSELGRIAAGREVQGEDVTELAKQGDRDSISILRETGTWLGIGLANFVNTLNPEVIAIGGGVVSAGDTLLEPARREIHLRARSPSRDLVEVKEATLGDGSGLLGAAALARDSSGELVLGS